MTTTTKPRKVWSGTTPIKCDLCNSTITNTFVDGRTRRGPWAMMCPACARLEGTGLGTGFGQQYSWSTLTNQWEKQ